MDDRKRELNFHSEYEQRQSVRIRDALLHNGHVTEEKPPAETCHCNHKSELHENEMVSLYAQRIRDNLKHELEYCPCYDSRDNDAS